MFNWLYKMHHRKWVKENMDTHIQMFVWNLNTFKSVILHDSEVVRKQHGSCYAYLVLLELREIKNVSYEIYKALADLSKDDLKLVVKVYRESKKGA